MIRRPKLIPAVLALSLLLPLPFLAVLCRGRSPSSFSTDNLPLWEQQAPVPALPLGADALAPAPLGTVQLLDASAPADREEAPPTDDVTGQTGKWLEAACAWGGDLRRRDQVAEALMNEQGERKMPGQRDWEARRSGSERLKLTRSLRGLLAYEQSAHSLGALAAARLAGNRLLGRMPPEPFEDDSGEDDPRLALGELYLATGDKKYLAAAEQGAKTASGVALCALYRATGTERYRELAEQRWQRKQSPELAAALLLLTGSAAYAKVVSQAPVGSGGSWLAQASYARTPNCLLVHLCANSRAAFGGSDLVQRVEPGSERTFIVQAPPATVFTLRVFTAMAEQIWVNGVRRLPDAAPGTYASVKRRWRDGDRVALKPPG